MGGGEGLLIWFVVLLITGRVYVIIETHNVIPTEFENKITLLAPEVAVDGYINLKPKDNEVKRM